jgi:arylsulfatase A-like enzyme
MVEIIDTNVGRFIDCLEPTGELDNILLYLGQTTVWSRLC